VRVNAAGLVALAEVNSVALHSTLTGTSSLLDIMVICPGLHRQQDAPSLSKGEYPACAAMTTGYVFRVENEAMVYQLQRYGKAGHLTTLKVSSNSPRTTVVNLLDLHALCYVGAASFTLWAAMALWSLEDFESLASLALLIIVRSINVIVFRRRAKLGWKGAPEPGVQADLLVLLSQDRWVRLQGLVDDVKAVTSGQWLRDMMPMESSLIAFATLLAYLNAALASNATKNGQSILVLLLFVSAGLLGFANVRSRHSFMYGRQIELVKQPQPYKRRLDLAEQLIRETKRDDWAIRLGMIQPSKGSDVKESDLGLKIM
jgi:hypothetical protein